MVERGSVTRGFVIVIGISIDASISHPFLALYKDVKDEEGAEEIASLLRSAGITKIVRYLNDSPPRTYPHSHDGEGRLVPRSQDGEERS